MTELFTKLIENKYFVFFSKAVGGIVILITFYSFFIKEKASLSYDILFNESIIDLREDVENLKVLYDSIDVVKDDFQLSSLVIRVQNKGQKSLTLDRYDPSYLPGLTIQNAKILSYEVTSTSDEYLSISVDLSISDNNLSFNQVIIDSKDFFDIKILTIHPDSLRPEVLSTGKIAGIDEIQVINSYDERRETTFFEDVFVGSFLVQVFKIFTYTLAFFVLLIILIAIVSAPSEKYYQKKRVRLVDKFIIEYEQYSKMGSDIIFKWFISKHEVDFLKNIILQVSLLHNLNSNSQNLDVFIELIDEDSIEAFRNFARETNETEKQRHFESTFLSRMALVMYDKKGFIFQEARIKMLNDFYLFIQENY